MAYSQYRKITPNKKNNRKQLQNSCLFLKILMLLAKDLRNLMYNLYL